MFVENWTGYATCPTPCRNSLLVLNKIELPICKYSYPTQRFCNDYNQVEETARLFTSAGRPSVSQVEQRPRWATDSMDDGQINDTVIRYFAETHCNPASSHRDVSRRAKIEMLLTA